MLDPDVRDLFGTVCEVSTASAAVAFEHPAASHTAIHRLEDHYAQLIKRVENHAYEGAGRDRNNGSNWLTSRSDTDGDLEADLDETRQRGRFLYRNDAIGGAIDERKDHVVGTGFTYQPQVRAVPGWISAAQAEQINDELEEVMEGLAPKIGASGSDSLWEDSRLVEGHHGFDGESVTILSDMPLYGDKPLPIVIEVIDPMRVETPPDKLSDPNCRLGIQYDERGIRKLGIWVRRQHPGNARKPEIKHDFYESSRIIHVFEKLFAGQSRGLAWLARTLYRLQNRKDLDEAGIVRSQIEACFVGFLKQTQSHGMGPDGLPVRLGGPGNRLTKEFTYNPGTVIPLGFGEEFQGATPPTGLGSADSLNMSNDRRIAAALGMAYEMLAKDWRGVSFAGGRIILSGCKQNTQVRQERIATRWLCPITERIVDEAVLLGKVSIPPRLYNARPLIYRRHEWIAQAWPYSVAPGEEIDALLKAVDGNLLPKAKAEAQYSGGNWKRTKLIRQRERQDERDLEIVPPLNAMGDEPTPQQIEQQNQKAGA